MALKTERGFTLVELLISVTLMGLLGVSLATISSFQGASNRGFNLTRGYFANVIVPIEQIRKDLKRSSNVYYFQSVGNPVHQYLLIQPSVLSPNGSGYVDYGDFWNNKTSWVIYEFYPELNPQQACPYLTKKGPTPFTAGTCYELDRYLGTPDSANPGGNPPLKTANAPIQTFHGFLDLGFCMCNQDPNSPVTYDDGREITTGTEGFGCYPLADPAAPPSVPPALLPTACNRAIGIQSGTPPETVKSYFTFQAGTPASGLLPQLAFPQARPSPAGADNKRIFGMFLYPNEATLRTDPTKLTNQSFQRISFVQDIENFATRSVNNYTCPPEYSIFNSLVPMSNKLSSFPFDIKSTAIMLGLSLSGNNYSVNVGSPPSTGSFAWQTASCSLDAPPSELGQALIQARGEE
jgi:prepilin-type N-terminal cleavage/methylation domain-containing protein